MTSEPAGIHPYDPDSGSVPDGVGALARDAEGEAVVFAVTAEADAEWAARTAVAVARRWAGELTRLFVMDLGLNAPGLHRTLGLPNEEGASDVFLYGSSVQRVARPVEGGAFFFASAGTPTADPRGVLAHERWPALLKGFRNASATVLLHLPLETPGADQVLERADRILVLDVRDGEGEGAVAGFRDRVVAVLTAPGAVVDIEDLAPVEEAEGASVEPPVVEIADLAPDETEEPSEVEDPAAAEPPVVDIGELAPEAAADVAGAGTEAEEAAGAVEAEPAASGASGPVVDIAELAPETAEPEPVDIADLAPEKEEPEPDLEEGPGAEEETPVVDVGDLAPDISADEQVAAGWEEEAGREEAAEPDALAESEEAAEFTESEAAEEVAEPEQVEEFAEPEAAGEFTEPEEAEEFTESEGGGADEPAGDVDDWAPATPEDEVEEAMEEAGAVDDDLGLERARSFDERMESLDDEGVLGDEEENVLEDEEEEVLEEQPEEKPEELAGFGGAPSGDEAPEEVGQAEPEDAGEDDAETDQFDLGSLDSFGEETGAGEDDEDAGLDFGGFPGEPEGSEVEAPEEPEGDVEEDEDLGFGEFTGEMELAEEEGEEPSVGEPGELEAAAEEPTGPAEPEVGADEEGDFGDDLVTGPDFGQGAPEDDWEDPPSRQEGEPAGDEVPHPTEAGVADGLETRTREGDPPRASTEAGPDAREREEREEDEAEEARERPSGPSRSVGGRVVRLVAVALVFTAGALAAHWFDMVRIPGADRVIASVLGPAATGRVPDVVSTDPGPRTAVMGYSLALDAYRAQGPALEVATAWQESYDDFLFVVAPVEVEGGLFYRLLAGPAMTSEDAEELRAALAEVLTREDPSNWVVRATPLAFLVSEHETLDAAETRAAQLAGEEIPAYVLRVAYVGDTVRYRVYVGAYESGEEARAMEGILSSAGFEDFRFVERRGTFPE